MAAYISAPRDFSKVKSKVAFNLTARQLVCFGAAAVVGVPLFFVLRDTAGNTGATLGMMAVMLPMFFLAMYQKNGQPAEKILMYYIQARFIRPKVRPYGLNALSNNLIMVDRKKLKNPNGLILGTPGSGKSFSAKREICNAFLVTDDDIVICDPECEVRHEVA